MSEADFPTIAQIQITAKLLRFADELADNIVEMCEEHVRVTLQAAINI